MKTVLSTFIALISCLVLAQCQNSESGKGGAGQVQISQQATVTDISAPEFKEQMGEPGVVVLDVRTPGEYAEGYIPGAMLADFMGDDFADRVSELDKRKTYLVYCHSGGRSSEASDKMAEMGFQHVYNLEGGISGWQQQGFEIAK